MATLAQASETTEAARPLRRAAWTIAAAMAFLAVYDAVLPRGNMPTLYFWTQDQPVVLLLLVLLAAVGIGRLPSLPMALPRSSMRQVMLAAAALALLLWAGTYLILFNYPLTRDEHMVVFDQTIFLHGRLAAPLAPEWRSFAQALTPAFLLPLPGNAAWVSAYMPVNAALRALFSTIADPALINPLWAAVGAVALYDIARRLFPDSRGTQAVALLLYLSSAQMLVNAMTAYAMTGHLALDLVWLALFLRGGRRGHGGAIAIGFLATGLHQVIFHPLFVLPFIDHLRRRGEWRTATVYVAAYAAFGLFWISYPHLVALSAGLAAESGSGAGGGGFIADRVLPLLRHRDPEMLPLMALNLTRFVVWQNLALLPLVLLGLPAARRGEGIAQPLYYGVLLTLVAMALLLPYQGHGGGYRYLHGLLGSCALLGAYGWRELGAAETVRGRQLLALGTAATLCLSLPFLLYQTYAFAKPYAEVNAMIGRIHTDFVVIDTEPVAFAIDEVRNDPLLTNRPLRFSSHDLSASMLASLCRRGTVAFVSREQMHRFGLGRQHGQLGLHFARLQQGAAANGCRSQ